MHYCGDDDEPADFGNSFRGDRGRLDRGLGQQARGPGFPAAQQVAQRLLPAVDTPTVSGKRSRTRARSLLANLLSVLVSSSSNATCCGHALDRTHPITTLLLSRFGTDL